MCGILGQINYSYDVNWDDNLFSEALLLQEHRGPDDDGIEVGNNFIFGHRRLSIIDLDSHAKQPMASVDGKVILVFNGEIYNYQELRNDLVKKGYKFNTKSDTEVLLYSYYEYGIECIQSFIGMFAFTIFDYRNGKSYIVRDRLGVKPLYYHREGGALTFSSEIKSILKLVDLDRNINIKAVSSYFSFRYPILNDTFFEGVHSVPPAHYIEISENSFIVKEYWNLAHKFKEQNNDKGEDYYIEGIRALLESSVKYRMLSDVPFGSFLSGGVDSSVITAIMSNESSSPIKTFIAGFKEEGYNEFEYANLIAKRFNTDHHEVLVEGEDYIKSMEELINYKDAPLSVPNEVPLYIMSKKLKKYITVVLSGEGADEIFGGYGRIFLSPYDLERIQNVDRLDLSAEDKHILCKSFLNKYGVDNFRSESQHFNNVYGYTSLHEKSELLNSSLPLDDIEQHLNNKVELYFHELDGESYYNKIMYAFEKIHLVGLLQRLDTSTMAASVEARVPFVDHRLVEFAFTIPFKYKIKWNDSNSRLLSQLLMSDKISEVYNTPKSILKSAYKDVIPDEILFRKKVGFPVPLNKWFGGNFNDYAKKILLSESAQNRGLYNIDNIQKWLNGDRLVIDHGFAMKIWMLINLELFNIKYFDECNLH
jgi:asparagine synthase (glutamine-hydrolysing)